MFCNTSVSASRKTHLENWGAGRAAERHKECEEPQPAAGSSRSRRLGPAARRTVLPHPGGRAARKAPPSYCKEKSRGGAVEPEAQQLAALQPPPPRHRPHTCVRFHTAILLTVHPSSGRPSNASYAQARGESAGAGRARSMSVRQTGDRAERSARAGNNRVMAGMGMRGCVPSVS